jgi:hypothetical protein
MASPGKRFQAQLARQVKQGVAPARIAEIATSQWRAFDAALSPIIGSQGVIALFRRCLLLTLPAYPWLGHVSEENDPRGDFDALQAKLAQQPSDIAAAASGALFQSFHDLLTTLIGGSLTERLLRSSWDSILGGSSTEESPNDDQDTH